MVSVWKIGWMYDKYVEQFEKYRALVVGDENATKLTQFMIQGDHDVGLDNFRLSVDNSDEFLINGHPYFPEVQDLPLEILCWLPIGLTKILQVQVTEDHTDYWWYTYSFAKAYDDETGLFPDGLIDNFELLIHLVSMRLDPQFRLSIDEPYKVVLSNSRILATYLGYPTLEGLVKFACRRDIRMDGKIQNGKKIRKLGHPDSRDYYHHSNSPGSGICSNLGALLWHYETEVARSEHSVRLSKMRSEVAELYGTKPNRVYGLLNGQRNDSLHGRHQGEKERGMLLNYCSLIIWATLLP
jgi:hypothetical protein